MTRCTPILSICIIYQVPDEISYYVGKLFDYEQSLTNTPIFCPDSKNLLGDSRIYFIATKL